MGAGFGIDGKVQELSGFFGIADAKCHLSLNADDLIVSADLVEYKRSVDALGGYRDDLCVEAEVEERESLAGAGFAAAGVLDDVVARLAFEIGET